ncbi:MAG: acetolactate synthase small subunit [bacterium]
MPTHKKSLHTLVSLVEDTPGVLSRIVNLFRKRGYNIESLSVGHSETKGISRMTFVVNESDTNVEQVIKQMYKIINVLKVSNITFDDAVEHELCLIKVAVNKETRQDLLNVLQLFSAKTVDIKVNSVIAEIVDTTQRIDDFVEVMRKFGIKELTRTGKVAMNRGQDEIKVKSKV